MNDRRTTVLPCLLACGLTFLFSLAAVAQVARDRSDDLGRRTVASGRLAAHTSVAPLAEVEPLLAPEVRTGWAAFQLGVPGEWRGYVDRQTGRLEYAEGAGLPWIPGRGNRLSREDIAPFLAGKAEADLPALERIARDFLGRVGKLLGVDPAELVLDRGRSGQVADYLWFVDFNLVRGGQVVEGTRVTFSVNNGNLIQFGTIALPAPEAAPPPAGIAREAALDVLGRHVGGFERGDRFSDPGSLHLLPVDSGEVASPGLGAAGRGLVAVWQFTFHRDSVMGNWRGRIDATTGELLAFGDVNDYAQVTGGIFPSSPVTTAEVVRPMPFTSLLPSGTTDSAGFYDFLGGVVSSSLTGPYVAISDTCGSISQSGNAFGDIAFGQSAGTDCVTPGSGGTGNTHSARMQFYQVNRIRESGRGWLPTNTWLSGQLTVNVNLNQTCNAYWDGVSLNFFRSGGGCGNTGEIAGVSLHEYGHGLDENDGNGPSPDGGSRESYADVTAVLVTHDSCGGPGFFGTNKCGGYGDACTACTGVRDIDWAKHTSGVAHTVNNFTKVHCPLGGGDDGPCAREAHCESYIPSEAMWDLAARDLPSPGTAAAWSLVDRLWYRSRAAAGSTFTCNTTAATWTSDGCAAGTLWRVLRAADDDDGNLANGTPHSCALFAALSRHGIACPGDPAAATCFAACTPPAVPTLTLTPSHRQVQLNWTSSGAGMVYDIYKNESTCSGGFLRIASGITGTSYLDGAVADGLPYNYQVIAHPSGNEACAAPPSACQTTTPTCTGAPVAGTATVAGPNQVQVSWTNGTPPASSFGVYRAVGTCAASGPFSRLGGTIAASPFLDTTASGTITYAYHVTGFDITGQCESAPSGCMQATATGPCTSAPAFAGLGTAASAGTATCSVQLGWAAATALCSGPVTYNVYRGVSPGFLPSPQNRIASGLSGTTFADSSPLANGGTYYYVVRAVDGGNGAEDGNLVRQSAQPGGAATLGPLSETFEAASGFDLPGWTHAALSGTQDWAWSAVISKSPIHSWFSSSLTTISDRVLVSPSFQVVAGTTLSFWHSFQFEGDTTFCFDGGTLEISTDGGATWAPLPDAAFTAGGFNGTINGGFGNPLAGKRAWCGGTLSAMSQVTASLGGFAGMTARLRWHAGDDSSNAMTGWLVDSVTLTNVQTVGVCQSVPGPALSFYTLTPCRLVDTRNPTGPLGGPVLPGSGTRSFTLAGACGVPATALALSVNVTVVQPAAGGALRAFAADVPALLPGIVNFRPGQTRTNNAILGVSTDGGVTVRNDATGAVDLLIDVNGYFQ